ncbi:MAG: OmpL47-type beta-barrel domain-containing protein, partial [Promethearchaeota archaeon]
MRDRRRHRDKFTVLAFILISSTIASTLNTGGNLQDGNQAINKVFGDITSSDLPNSYSSTFSGESSSTTLTAGFTNATSTDVTVNIQNTFSDETREEILDLSSYAHNGYSLYKIDINVSGNKVTALDDWVIVGGSPQSTPQRRIKVDDVTSNYQMIGNEITDTMRYQMKQISTYFACVTFDSNVPAPAVELWNATSGTGEPDDVGWTTDLPTFSGIQWYNTTPNYIINASASSNNTWLVVINGTDWGSSSNNVDSSNYVEWRCEPSTSQVGWTKTWGAGWNDEYYRYGLKYRKLYVNDSNSNARVFTPAGSYLRANNSLFDTNGRLSVTGSNITSLNFTTNTTSMTFDVSMKMYYKKSVTATRAFSSDGSDAINWTITSDDNITFPSGTKSNVEMNCTIPTTWSVWGVYNASDVAGLSSATNYTQYSMISGVLNVINVASDSTWQVRCDSVNQISGIVKNVGGSQVTDVNATNTVGFHVNLQSTQSTGNLTLGIYYPPQFNNSLAFSTYNDSFGGPVATVEFSNDWSVPNVLGIYRIQSRWNISEEVGYRLYTFVVYGDMDIVLNSIDQYGSSLVPASPGENFEKYVPGMDIDSESNEWSLVSAGNYTFNAEFVNDSMKGYFVDNDSVNNGYIQYDFKNDSPNNTGNFSISLDLTVKTANFYIRILDNTSTSIVYLWIHPTSGRIYTYAPALTLISGNIWTSGLEETLEIHFIGNDKHYITYGGVDYDNGGSYYSNQNYITGGIGSIRVFSGLTLAKCYFDNIVANWTNPDWYKATYGDDVTYNYSMADNNNASTIPSLDYSFTIEGSLDNQGTDSTGSHSEVLNFDTRSIGDYSVVVNFNKTFYNNFSHAYTIEVFPCPTDVALINITQNSAMLYQNGSSINFANDGSNITVALNYSNAISNSLITGGSANVSDTSNHYYASSSTGIYFVEIRPTDLAANTEISFQSYLNKSNYYFNNVSFPLYVDTTNPNTSISYTATYAPDFVDAAELFTLTPSEGSGESGLASTQYQLNNGGWLAYSAPFNLASQPNGTVRIDYRSADNVGNQEVFGTIYVQLDINAPNTSISYTATYAPDFVDAAELFTLTTNDNGVGESGVALTQYQLNNGGWLSYSAPFNLATQPNGTVRIDYRSTDNVGNQEVFGTIYVQLDINAPNTSISYTADYAPTFVNAAALFTLSFNDNGVGESGVASTQYQLNNGGWLAYTVPFNLASQPNGTVQIDYRSTDNVGNQEVFGTIYVQLDINAPNTSISYTATYAPDFVDAAELFTLTYNDNGAGESGVASTQYQLNGGGWLPYTVPFNLSSQPNGTVQIDYRSTDNVGNQEAFGTIYVQLDINAPNTSISYTAT